MNVECNNAENAMSANASKKRKRMQCPQMQAMSAKLYCDNEPVVLYAHNNKSSNAAKHIDIKYYVVKDKI
jgi:hypothetical protein